MAWRLAKSLEVLRSEINAAAPKRSKASDGTIGDDAHQASASDHNPNQEGVVCAADFTHDPDDGADMNVFAEILKRRKHRAVKYVIWNRRIWSKARDGEGWRAYKGANPHTKHMHVSVGVGDDGHSTGPYDDTSTWGISGIGADPAPQKPSKPTTGTKLEDKMPTLKRGAKGRDVKILQALLGVWGWRVAVDGIFGKRTEEAVRAFQAKYAKPVDGIPGPITWRKLLNQ